MRACIIAVGSELLTPSRIDTNSLTITEQLNSIGIDVRYKAIAGDDVEELKKILALAVDSVDLVICTGGLGPTEDDVTRDAVAGVLNLPMQLDESVLDGIRQRFARRGINMPDINTRQAMVPRGATVLKNPNGTAPGLMIEQSGVRIVLLPGPPREMTPMLRGLVTGALADLTSGRVLIRRVLRITGRTESDVDSNAQPVYAKWRTDPVPISTTILAVLGQIELHLTATAASKADADTALDAATRELQQVLGSSVYSVDGRPLEKVVGDLLKTAGWRVAAAESCSGGLLSSRLTDVPGSSDYVEGGVVCYSNRLKVAFADVPSALIQAHGAVSEPVARALASGIRQRTGVEAGIGITGIAGPDGGTAEKPVGTVAIAVDANGVERVRTFHFIGAREQVKYQSTQAALNMLRLLLEERLTSPSR